MTTKVSVFDADYLNEVNTKRLDDLKQLERHEKSKDVVKDYLDKETAAGRIRLHESDAKNELINQDVLLEKLNNPLQEDYETPLKVVEKYNGLSSLDDLARSIDHIPSQPIS